MGVKLVQVFAVLRHYSDGICECVAECNSHACVIKAVKYYGGVIEVRLPFEEEGGV